MTESEKFLKSSQRRKPLHYMVFDTETVSLEKPFCYNVGYIIADSDNGEIVCKREYVIEQIWSNAELFTTAYYADKRQLYIGRMRARRVLLEKWGYVTQQIIRDIKAFEVQAAYAYNSPFDEKVFAFCCDWFKTINPFDLIPVLRSMPIFKSGRKTAKRSPRRATFPPPPKRFTAISANKRSLTKNTPPSRIVKSKTKFCAIVSHRARNGAMSTKCMQVSRARWTKN